MALNINGLFPGELTPDVCVAGCINIYENVWPDPHRTIQLAEQECADKNSGVYWERAGTIGSGPNQDMRTNQLLAVSHLADLTNNIILQNIHNQLYITLLASTNPYSAKFGIQESFFHEGYSLLKYSGGQEYKSHYDGTTDIGRIISAIVYLNDDFEGGELEFPNFELKIKPQAGMLVLFPSNFAYSHIAHPVTEGTKYALVTWIKDRPLS